MIKGLIVFAACLTAAGAVPALAQTPPTLSVSLTPAAATEGSRFKVSFTRAGDLSQRSSAAWRISGAVDAADFTRALTGSVTFNAGQSQKGFWLQSVNDDIVEADEAFNLSLSASSNAVLGASIASSVIRNDDIPTRAPLTLVNPGDPAYWAQEDAFINHILVTGRNVGTWISQGLYDPITARFVKMPPTGRIKIGEVRGGALSPSAGDYYKGKWILEWDGDGDLALQGAVGPITRISANRIEEDYDPTLHGRAAPLVFISRIGPAGVSNIRFYRGEHEALLAAGKVFTPEWIADISRFDAFRPMNWTGVNGDVEITAADRPLANSQFYINGRVPDEILVGAAIDTGTQLWLNAPGLLGCPASIASTMRDVNLPTATRVAAAAGAFDAIMASPEPLNWARKIVALLNSSGYPVERPIFIELDNEVWNSKQWASTDLHSGIGRVLSQRYPQLALPGNARNGYGYRSAQFASAFAQALAEAGRGNQIWTMVLAVQTVQPNRTPDIFSTIPLYSPAIGAAEPMSRYGVSTTNYFSGSFLWNPDDLLFGVKMDQASWLQRWQAELAADPVAFRQKLNDYLLSPTPMRANLAFYKANVRAHQAVAEAAGARWIGNYEGDSHEKLDQNLVSNPAALALFRSWHESDEYGRIIRAIGDDVRQMNPNAFIANYVFCGKRRSPDTPWVECTPWDKSGADNAAWDALLKPVP
jgi:hypothetical protein